MAAVQEVMPHASNEVVLSDLASTGSAEETITNLLEGRAVSAGRIVNGQRCVIVNGRSVVLGRSAGGSAGGRGTAEGGVGGVVGGMSRGGMSRSEVGSAAGGSAEVLPSAMPSRGVPTTAGGAGGGPVGRRKGRTQIQRLHPSRVLVSYAGCRRTRGVLSYAVPMVLLQGTVPPRPSPSCQIRPGGGSLRGTASQLGHRRRAILRTMK